MFQKWFPKESVEQYLEKYTESWESILDTDFFQRKIDSYARKWKSRKFIFQTLSETTEDREVLEWLLDIYFVDGETKNIEKHYKKLLAKLTSNLSVAKRGEKWSTFLRQRIIQKLLEKWFQYDDIKNIVM